MPKFLIEVDEVHSCKYHVKATSYQDALRLYRLSSENVELQECSCYTVDEENCEGTISMLDTITRLPLHLYTFDEIDALEDEEDD